MPELYSFQRAGAQWLSQKKFALLADEMGLGKSAQVISACDALRLQRILILCPAVARLNWLREWEKFTSLERKQFACLSAADATHLPHTGVVVCSYDLASTPRVSAVLAARPWDVCVYDESHYLKNRRAKRTKVAFGPIAAQAERVWALSGTPAPNHPAELWPLLQALGAYTNDYWTFARRYCHIRETPFGTQITGGRNIPELRKILAPILLRRRKKEVMPQLPDITFADVAIEPTEIPDSKLIDDYWPNYKTFPRERQAQVLFDDLAIQSRILETLTGDIGFRRDTAIPVLQGLEHKVKSLRRWIGLRKVPNVVKMIEAELKAGAYDKIVLFGVHKDVLKALYFGFEKYGSVLVYGGTPARKRDKLVQRFQDDPQCRVFVGQVVAAGTAISLTAAHHVGMVEADWTPAVNQQAIMRVHRIGQTMPVLCRFFGLAGSLDEQIQRVLQRKTKVLIELFDK